MTHWQRYVLSNAFAALTLLWLLQYLGAAHAQATWQSTVLLMGGWVVLAAAFWVLLSLDLWGERKREGETRR